MPGTAFFIIDYSITGGVERVNANLARLFEKNNIDTNYIISLRSANPVPEINYPKHLKVIVLFPNGNEKDIATVLANKLQENNIGTLIYQGDNMTITLAVQKAASITNCKTYLHYHGSPYGYLRKYIYWQDIVQKPLNVFKLLWSRIVYPFKKTKLRKVIVNATDGFVCVSEGVRSELLQLFSLPVAVAEKVICIPNPLTFDVKPTDSFAKQNMIVYVSRLHRKHKNSMMALQAWNIIEKKYPGWQLYIMGDGVLKSSMEKYCLQHNLQQVIFTGMVNNVQSYLQTSAISILTSDCEGLGMGMLESASYKNALLATKADGGITDIVEDGITGWLVPRNDIARFAKKLSLLIEDENLRKMMGENAYNKLTHFNDDTIIMRWKQLLAKR